MDFKSHYNHIVNKANSTLGFIIRWSKEFCDPYITKHLFITYVRPILEYSSQVWSPYRDIDISRIESVQKKFLRFALRNLPWADPIRLPPYESRLSLINLTSLQSRRLVADILFVQQIIRGQIISPYIREQMRFRDNPSNLRTVELFHIAYHSTDYGKFEPITRMLRETNSLSELFDINVNKLTLKARLYASMNVNSGLGRN